MYHRIAESAVDPWGLCVSPAHFAEHLEVLRQHARPAPLAKLQSAIAAGPDRPAVAITFDDGYADNLRVAAPLLARFDVPATVFVTTGYTERGVEFWWDALESIFLGTGELPNFLEVAVGETVLTLDLSKAAHRPPEATERYRSWRAYASDPPSVRHTAFLSIWERLVSVRDAEQWRVLGALARWAGLSDLSARETHRPLAPGEVVALATSAPIEIGAHTVTHPALPALPERDQEAEIRDSRLALEALLGRLVAGFSYPHGRYSPATVRLVRNAGFSYACTATPEAGPADPFRIPRVQVPDCDGDALARLLTGADA